jgi:hypothetical protein
MPSPASESTEEPLLRPRGVAALLGTRATATARWARTGRLQSLLTLGGHRRYRSTDVRGLLERDETSAERQQFEQDAVRLYEQGWSIRQVADRFGSTYGAMRRILARHTTLRYCGGAERLAPSAKHHPSIDGTDDVAG